METIAQHITPLAQWFAALLTQAEWSALLWLISGTLVFTHFFKIAWRLLPVPGGGSHNIIHLTSGLIGTAIAFSVWPASGHAPWWLAGPVAGGGGAITIYKMFWPVLSTMFPAFTAKLNAERRKRNVGPPGGVSRRKEDSDI